jgi:hypothetical protein
MTLPLEAQRQTCERQLERLRAPDLERHELLDVATTLLLLIGSADSDDADDVAGHNLGREQNIGTDAVARVRGDLAWVQSCARTGSVDELRDRAQYAAQELCRQLGMNPNK